MFGLLAFFFKLFFSTFFAILFSYFIIEEEKNNISIIVFSMLGTSLASTASYSMISDYSLSYSILVLAMLYLSYNFFNISINRERIFFIFPGIIGLMIGFGLILQSVIIIIFLYIAKNNLTYMYESNSSDDNIEKNKEK